jgi:RpiR family transcriptional regulator, carbohydrate utilization regulator
MVISDIKRTYNEMHGAERKVADFILADPQRVTGMSMAELSAETGTSDATVMRMCRRIELTGFYQLKINLAMEGTDAAAGSGVKPTDGPQDIVSLVDVIAANVAQLSKDISAEQIDACVDLIAEAGTVFTFGWGNTGTLADDMARRLLCYGANTFTSTNIEYMMRSVALAGPGDLLIAFSRSGESVYTIECCKLAQANGLKVILITGDAGSAAAKHADVVLKAHPINDVMDGTWGSSSHVYEFVVIDVILFFLRDRCPAYKLGAKSEAILSQFKN